MGVYVYVGNLERSVDEDSVRAAFAAGGRPVRSVVILRTPRNDRSRGFGFVELESPDDATAVIQSMDGVELEGRPLKVSEARERPPTRIFGRTFDGFRSGGAKRRSNGKRPRSRS